VDEAALLPVESELAKLPASTQQPEAPKKKRGPKGPNPLSVKRKKPAVPQFTQPKIKSDPMPIGSKRKREDVQDGVEASTGPGQASGGGHKRKRRRKPNAEPSPDHAAS